LNFFRTHHLPAEAATKGALAAYVLVNVADVHRILPLAEARARRSRGQGPGLVP